MREEKVDEIEKSFNEAENPTPNDPFINYSLKDFLKVCMDLIDAVTSIGKIDFSGVSVSFKNPINGISLGNDDSTDDTSTGVSSTYANDTSTNDTSTNSIFSGFSATAAYIKSDIKQTKLESRDFGTWLESAVNLTYNGLQMLKSKPCPVCGKPMGFYIPKEGCCSLQCAMKLIAMKVLKTYKIQMGQNQAISAALNRILEYINLLINLTTALPGMIIHVQKIPDIYKKFLIVELNRVFIKIKIILNRLLIWKNNLIIKILKWIRNGVIGQSLQAMFSWLTAFLQSLQAMKEAFNTAYNVAMNVINAISAQFCIPGESYGFLCTPRSIMKNPMQMLVQIQATGNFNVSNFLNTMITDMRAGADQALTGISGAIEKTFPPIQAPEYFLEPTIFKVRCFFSDNNSKMIANNIKLMEVFMKCGAEYIPKWEDLTLMNPFYVLALFIGWGPTAQMCYGMPMYP